jgi:hypothetical protein
MYLFPVRIYVDPERPARNGPFIIMPVNDIEGIDGKSFFHGYALFYNVDMRWILDNPIEEPYSARVFSSNMLSFKCMAWPYSLLAMHDELQSELPRNIMNAVESEHHKCHEDPIGYKYNSYIIEFPSSQELSSKLINADAGENEELEMDMIELEYERADGSKNADGSKKTNSEVWACWLVARTDTTASKRGKVEFKEKKSKAALLLEKMQKKKLNGMKSEE